MIKKTNAILFTICLIILFVGCTNLEYEGAFTEYRNSYFRATEFLASEKNINKALEIMDARLLEKEIESMQKSIDKMKSTAKSKLEKGLCENRNKEIERLKFLLYANKNIENMTFDEKTKVQWDYVAAQIKRKEFLEDMEK